MEIGDKSPEENPRIMQSISGWQKRTNPKRFPEFGLQRWWAREGKDPEIIENIDDGLPL